MPCLTVLRQSWTWMSDAVLVNKKIKEQVGNCHSQKESTLFLQIHSGKSKKLLDSSGFILALTKYDIFCRTSVQISLFISPD